MSIYGAPGRDFESHVIMEAEADDDIDAPGGAQHGQPDGRIGAEELTGEHDFDCLTAVSEWSLHRDRVTGQKRNTKGDDAAGEEDGSDGDEQGSRRACCSIGAALYTLECSEDESRAPA
jgi:hypothetical protein